MDWSRAKTILILAFLILDLFLAYQVYSTRTELWKNADASENDQWNLELFLQQQNIDLQATIPEETPELSYLNIKMPGVDAILLKKLQGVKITAERSSIYSELQPPMPLPDQTNPEELLQELDDRLLYAGQYQIDPYFSTGDRLVYHQTYQNLPLYIAPLEIYIQNGAVKSYRQTYYQISLEGTARETISAYTALRSLVEKQMIEPGEKIIDVSLGYYGFHYDADIQVLAPVWRVITQGGKTQYLNAFTGTMERPIQPERVTRK
ncbi:two-component system regulatory protein YycI [Brevibacillus fulvus]|uniref:Regulatory protein YycI of two-component signal transduction system YycFG n=1 Tax=Brevibacillus fulvus TaxID=1125967 RepID=A0A938Y5T7_9BACL|nr:two-component system regulatory protein YycI [Brevibacillus fulvus]MBM7591790.1 regulatory protein YycI of two-component signal transduction system YycFG [Brevibacillus fulvus]